MDEVAQELRIESTSSVLARRGILHTDSAKACKHVGPVVWRSAGAHHGNFEESDPFAQYESTHTSVTPKRKVGLHVQFVAPKTVVLPSGDIRRLRGGTQMIDGFWSYLRRVFGKRACTLTRAI